MSGEPGTGRPWLRLLVGAVALVAGAGFVVFSLGAMVERAAYRRAAPCGPAVTRSCVTDVSVPVLDRYEEWRSKSRHSYLVVSLPGREREKVELADPEEVWGRVRAGDTVAVRIWDGRATRVTTAGGHATEAEDSPLVSPLSGIGIGVAYVGFGAYQALTARQMARESWRRAAVPPIATLSRIVSAAVSVGGAAAYLAVQWLDLFTVPPLALLSVVATVATAAHLVRGA